MSLCILWSLYKSSTRLGVHLSCGFNKFFQETTPNILIYSAVWCVRAPLGNLSWHQKHPSAKTLYFHGKTKLLMTQSNPICTEENACELDDSTSTIKVTKIQCPAIKDRYRLCGMDVSLSFYAFQMVFFNNQDSLNMEEHVQHVLALSGILLGIFGRENLLNIHKALQEQFSVGVHTPVFNEKISSTALNIVKNLKRERTSRIDAQIDLLLARNSFIIDI
ncbi:unnamed protein product [Rhizopus stolonifer]